MRRLLVANRGEIARRIIRAARELRVETVAVYSAADRHAPHVVEADDAIAIGPSSASESYLSIPRLLAAAKSSGADAVHPGYGFLSENASFAQACARVGLLFVGPPAAVIGRMGSKIEARALVASTGVPVVPGTTPENQSDLGIARALDQVGLPALIKAAAGGGGKGMRRVLTGENQQEAIEAARREAVAAFGDGTLYVERLLDRPHHVEVQVFADDHGHLVHLFERECSVQRRHQKIIEESPSVLLTPQLRATMTEAALTIARAVEYRNAGTIEFLVDTSRAFYFLEMNTRLQVEHPVTEQVTGLDLVRAQLLVASGQPLPWAQAEISQRGHALEARVYAEDPSRGFLPQAGRLSLYREPRFPGVRVDGGIEEGGEVPVYYDPLIAKVIVTAETREFATRRLILALGDFHIEGVRTNIPFLLRILDEPAFRDGAIDTGFVDRVSADLAVSTPVSRPSRSALLRVQMGLPATATAAIPAVPDIPAIVDPWDSASSSSAPRRSATSSFRSASSLPHGAIPSHDHASATSRQHARAGVQILTAPMPATVIGLPVKVGDPVKKGDIVVMLEAMKMELPIRAPASAIVAAIRCSVGDLVEADGALVELQ